MQKLYKIKVDISKKYAMPAFEVNTNDLKSIRLSIEVLNGSSPLDLSDKTVRIAIRKPDNNIVFQDCEIKDAATGQVEVILENQAYITPGTHTAEIMCYKGNDVVAVSGTFSYKSTKGIMNNEAVESRSEFTTITGMLKDVQDTIKDVRENGTGIDVQARSDIEKATAQLAETVKEVNGVKPTNGKITLPIPEVDTSNLRLKTEKLNQTDLSEELLQQMAGDTPINAIPADGTVTPEKTTFFKEESLETNLFSIYPIRENGYYHETTGEWTTSTILFSIDGFIPVQQNVKYSTNAYNVRRYDANGTYLGTLANNVTSFLFNDGTTAKIRPNYRTSLTSKNDAFLYEFGYKVDKLIVQTSNLSTEIKEKLNKIDEIQDPGTGGLAPEFLKQTPLPAEKFMHFSCDDFITPFQDLHANQNTYTSIFQNAAFAFLKNTHDKYGITYSAYCFYENADGSFNLSMVPDKFKKEFLDNSHWLKFGFHGKSSNTSLVNATTETAIEQYNQVITQILRFTGSYKCIDRMPRLQNYAGNRNAVMALRNLKGGIVGLLTAEDNRTNYYHSVEQTNHLLSNDRLYEESSNLFFFSTDIRIDTNSTPKSFLETRKADTTFKDKMNDLVIFQHDPNIANVGHQPRIIECCEYAIENGYRFDFPMNVVMR